MNIVAAARRFIALTSRRSPIRRDDDPADPGDMGTAFGLDAITVLESDTQPGVHLTEPLSANQRFEDRLHRRSGL